MKIDLQVYVDEIIIGDAADKYGLNRYKENWVYFYDNENKIPRYKRFLDNVTKKSY